jgi:hypothetical protein
MRKGFLIYEEVRKFFPIYEEAVSHICILHPILLDFLIPYENFISFLSVCAPSAARLRTGGVERTPPANEEKVIMRRGLKRKAGKIIVVRPGEGERMPLLFYYRHNFTLIM